MHHVSAASDLFLYINANVWVDICFRRIFLSDCQRFPNATLSFWPPWCDYGPSHKYKMGGSVGAYNKQKHMNVCNVFVDELLVEGEAFLKSDTALRKDFVEFIKGGAWAANLESFEDNMDIPASSESPWEKFGYDNPSTALNSLATTGGGTRTVPHCNTSDDPGSGRSSKPCPAYQKMVLEELYAVIGDCGLFGPDELRAVIIAALLPLFLSSSEYTASTSTSMDDYSVSDSSVRNVIENRNVKFEHPKSEHLQEWLSGAAASFDGSELEAYLLDPHSSWVDDYIRALKALPAVISLSTTGAKETEALEVPSVGGLLAIKGAATGNIHSTFCAEMSLHDTERAGQAMFDAETYKQGVLCTNGLYQLRALKPVFNNHGSRIYALSVESAQFGDPSLLHNDKESGVVAGKTFRQVDNLLLLLPLLIRNFSASPSGFVNVEAQKVAKHNPPRFLRVCRS